MLQSNICYSSILIDTCACTNSGYQALLSPEGPGYEARFHVVMVFWSINIVVRLPYI